jgi:hypothetical protein
MSETKETIAMEQLFQLWDDEDLLAFTFGKDYIIKKEIEIYDKFSPLEVHTTDYTFVQLCRNTYEVMRK